MAGKLDGGTIAIIASIWNLSLLKPCERCMSEKTETAGKILNALRLLNQLIHPGETQPIMAKWKCEIEEAITLQESIYENLQKGLAS